MSAFRMRLIQLARRGRRNFQFRVLNPARYAAEMAVLAMDRWATADTDSRPCRILLVSDAQALTSEQQLNPFFCYRSDLKKSLKIFSLHLLLEDALFVPKALFRSFDVIALKISFRTDAKDAARIVRRVREIARHRPLLYFDGDDDICVMHPELLSHIDLYVKKHAFRDRTQYLRRF